MRHVSQSCFLFYVHPFVGIIVLKHPLMYRTLLSIILALIAACPLHTQVPFSCDGSAYLVISPGSFTRVHRVTAELSTGNVVFELLSETQGVELNGIGYRRTDNLIYGISFHDDGLYRVDATGNIERIAELDFEESSFYPAGDVSPDGRYLVLLGRSNSTQVLCFVDLEDENYNLTRIPTSTLNEESFFCTDIAYDPISGLIFGFDTQSRRMVSIDPETGIVDNTSYPVQEILNNTPSVYFDSFGNLFGLGSGSFTSTEVSLYKINTQNGQAELFAPADGLGGNSDGCSCPAGMALNQTFAPRQSFPCTQTRLSLRIANLTGSTQTNTQLYEALPPLFTVQEVLYNPYDGDLGTTIGANEIDISNLTIPPGLDSLVFLVDFGMSPFGTYQQQASLSGLNIGTNPDSTILSDDATTVIPNDPSTVEIVPLLVDLENNQLVFCEGDEHILRSVEGLGIDYRWNDGSTESTLRIDSPGLYAVTVNTGCEVAVDTVAVDFAVLELDLGENITIDLGDATRLHPIIGSSGEVVDYQWYSGFGELSLIECDSCTQLSDIPLSDTQYTLFIRDEFGCETADNVTVQVLKRYEVFAPNVFSPNNDGSNDLFFLQTKYPVVVEEFLIFDRWGSLQFSVSSRQTNIPFDGWDGNAAGQPAPSGVYLWTARLRWQDGEVRQHSGDVMIMR